MSERYVDIELNQQALFDLIRMGVSTIAGDPDAEDRDQELRSGCLGV